MSKTALLLVAAGRGERAKSELPKQWERLGDSRVIDHALAAFDGLVDIKVVVHHADDSEFLTFQESVLTCEGAQTRALSVKRGLEALAAHGDTETVLIHDAARALTPPAVIKDVLASLKTNKAAAPALAVTDALWRSALSDNGPQVAALQDRTGLFRAQTPQGFDFEAILSAHRTGDSTAADDVEIARAAGISVCITQGSEENFKITHPEDFARAQNLLKLRAST